MDKITKIFLDGGDPAETAEADAILKKAGRVGLEGQTTNPSLISQNLAARLGGRKFTGLEGLEEYRRIVREMSIITKGPISIQVTAHPEAPVDVLVDEARDHLRWIPSGVIKFPCTRNGLEAARIFSEEGPVNITLVFSQEQAAAVYAATFRATAPYPVYISPFVGRLDDKGENGMDVVRNILRMFREKSGDGGHVSVLTASVRKLSHLLYALALGSDAVTAPLPVIREWASQGAIVPNAEYTYYAPGLTEIPYRDLGLDRGYGDYDIHHPLTEAGVTKFAADWQKNLVLAGAGSVV